MKKSISTIIIFVMLFSIFTAGSVSAIQNDAKEFNNENVYDYKTLQKHYEKINNRALEYILQNKTIQGLDRFITPEYEMYIQEKINYKEEINMEFVENVDNNELLDVIDNLVIDDVYSTIYIYSDSSFIIESVQVIDTDNDKILMPNTSNASLSSSDGRKTYEYDDFNIPTRTPYAIETWYYFNLATMRLQLNTYVDVEDSDTVSVAYHNTDGSYAISPTINIVLQDSREINEDNLSHTCFTEGFFLIDAGLSGTSNDFIQKAIVLQNDRLLVTSYLYLDR